MRHRSIDWDEIKRSYKENNIKIINFPITDMSVDEIRYKAYEGALVLNELVNKYEVKLYHLTMNLISIESICSLYSRNLESTACCGGILELSSAIYN